MVVVCWNDEEIIPCDGQQPCAVMLDDVTGQHWLCDWTIIYNRLWRKSAPLLTSEFPGKIKLNKQFYLAVVCLFLYLDIFQFAASMK